MDAHEPGGLLSTLLLGAATPTYSVLANPTVNEVVVTALFTEHTSLLIHDHGPVRQTLARALPEE